MKVLLILGLLFYEVSIYSGQKIINNLRKPIGTNVRLQCIHGDLAGNIKIQWIIKQCGEHFGIVCKESDIPFMMNDYIIIESGIKSTKFRNRNICQQSCKTLNILNLQMIDSGIYECYAVSNTNSSLHTFEKLNVFELIPIDFDRKPPYIIKNFPSNLTVYTDQEIILQCKAKSRHFTTIWWFKYMKKMDSISEFDLQNIEVFKTIETVLLNGIYLSKLYISHATMQNTGYYECLAVNYFGYSEEVIYLNVVNHPDLHVDLDSQKYLLFIIPVLFLLIPLAIWICYIKYPMKYKVIKTLLKH